jgi:hypothetical protein
MVQTFSEIRDEFFRYMGDIVYATMTTVAAWVEDPKVEQRVWKLYRRGSPPRAGYDPGKYWRGPADPDFAVLRLDSWRVQVVRDADLRSRIWSAETNRRAPVIPVKRHRKVTS